MAAPTSVTSVGGELDVEKPPAEPNDEASAVSDASDTDLDADTYPEGGLEAWIVTFGAWCAMGMLRIVSNAFTTDIALAAPSLTYHTNNPSRRPRPGKYHLPHPSIPVREPIGHLLREQHQLDLQHLCFPCLLLRATDWACV